MGFFDTDDLKKLARQKKEAVLDKVGDWNDWVTGADLPGADQINDPDVAGAVGNHTSSSSSGC
jgi:hypothetical protein